MIFASGARTISARAKVGVHLLLLKPAQKFLVARIGQDSFDGVVFVAELIMRPGFMDEIFAGAAGRDRFAAAFAARNDVVFAGGGVAIAEGAFFFRHILAASDDTIKWCSWQDPRLHWRRSRRRASAFGLHEQKSNDPR